MIEKDFKITFPLELSEIRAIISSFVVGYVQLSGGQATIEDARISTDSFALVSRKTTGGTIGDLRINVSNNIATINSSSSSDTSVVWYLIIPYAIIQR